MVGVWYTICHQTINRTDPQNLLSTTLDVPLYGPWEKDQECPSTLIQGLPTLLDFDLQSLLLALSQQLTQPSHGKKRYWGVKKPDPFSGRSPDELHVFIFQYQIYFRACEGEFSEDTEKVFFAISYLWGAALDYFEPFINEPDPYQDFDFLKN